MAEKKDEVRAESELKVTDRRQFTAEGNLRPEAAEAQEPPETEPAATTEPEPQVAGGRQDGEFEHTPVEEPQGVDFTMLINAMAEPALLFLGEIAHPATGEPKVDLERSRIQIDMLGLLRVKCRGNLTPEEEGLLDRILYQLRMLYMAKAEQPGT